MTTPRGSIAYRGVEDAYWRDRTAGSSCRLQPRVHIDHGDSASPLHKARFTVLPSRSLSLLSGLIMLVVLVAPTFGDASTRLAGAPVNLTLPSISRSPILGQTLTASTGSWTKSPTTYRYSWKDCNSAGYNCISIGDATRTSLLLGTRDVGHTIRVVVTASISSGSGTAQSLPTKVVQSPPARDVAAPSVPSGLSTSGVGQSAVTLSWAASSDNVGVTGYRLFLGGGQVGTSLTTSYVFAGLACGTSYTLGVAALDAAGNVSSRAIASVATSACPDVAAPSVPSGLSTSGVGQSAVTLSWAASSDNVGVTGYRLFLGGGQIGTSLTTSYVFAGLACGTSYTLGVAALDAAGNVSSRAIASVATSACPDVAAPSVPSGLSTSGVGQSAVTLSWSASSDNVGVTGYRLYLGGGQVGTSLTTSYVFAGLACGTSYTLGVAALDAAGNVSSRAIASVATSACPDVAAPSVPSGLSTSGVGQSAVTLSWAASSDNVGVTGYRLFLGGGQVGTSLTTSYVFAGLACGTSYTLGVAALDAAGNVSSRAIASVATSACPDVAAPSVPSGLSTSGVGQSAVTLVLGCVE